MKFAEYRATRASIEKDGHVMMFEDIAKELNRKSHLEEENKKLKAQIQSAVDCVVNNEHIEDMGYDVLCSLGHEC